MKTGWLVVIVLFLIIIIGLAILIAVPAPAQAPAGDTATATTTDATSTDDLSDSIQVTSPLPNSIISSTTIVITGKARGSWFFEGQFPVEIINYGGSTVAKGIAHAQGDWTTSDFVPFVATLQIPGKPSEPLGVTVYLHNDNPSGDPSRDKEKTFDLTLE